MTVNVEKVVIGATNADDRLDGIPVVGEVPKDRPDRFITVERTGGAPQDVRDLPFVTAHAWDKTRQAASETAMLFADILRDLAVTHPSIARVSIESIYNDPDISGYPRYRITAQIVTHDV